MHTNIINNILSDYNIEIVENTGEILSDKDKDQKERPWKQHKVENEGLLELFKKAKEKEFTLISDTRLESLKECGSTLWFLANKENKLKLLTANFCKVRLCPMCSWRKSLKLFGQVSQIANELLRREKEARFIFVTFTVKNCKADELTETINKMNRAFSYLVDEKRNFASAKKFKNVLLGYMKAIEVTYNQKEDSYHPHIHALFAVKEEYFKSENYITKSKWQELWTKAIKSDLEYIVHVETVKNSTAKAVAEVAKYPVKATDLLKIKNKKRAVNALIVLHKTLKNRRLVTFGGLFKTIKSELKLQDVEDENADLIHSDEKAEEFEPVKLILYKWQSKFGAYIC